MQEIGRGIKRREILRGREGGCTCFLLVVEREGACWEGLFARSHWQILFWFYIVVVICRICLWPIFVALFGTSSYAFAIIANSAFIPCLEARFVHVVWLNPLFTSRGDLAAGLAAWELLPARVGGQFSWPPNGFGG